MIILFTYIMIILHACVYALMTNAMFGCNPNAMHGTVRYGTVTSMAAWATRVILFRAWLYSYFAAAIATLEQKTYTDS